MTSIPLVWRSAIAALKGLPILQSFAPSKFFEIILKCRKCFAIQIQAEYIVVDEPTAATLITTLKCLQVQREKTKWMCAPRKYSILTILCPYLCWCVELLKGRKVHKISSNSKHIFPTAFCLFKSSINTVR